MIKIEDANISPDQFVGRFSRYLKRQKVVYYGEERFLTFDTYIRTPYVQTGQEQIMIITKGVEFRPDLVSFDSYGSSSLWWWILEANGMHDVFEFKSGRTILLPNII